MKVRVRVYIKSLWLRSKGLLTINGGCRDVTLTDFFQ